MNAARSLGRVPIALAVLACVATLGAYARPPVVQAASTPFTDIAGTTFEADIEWLWAEGITKGCTATLYCPDRHVTRAEMASFLVRMFALVDGGTTDAFNDDDGTTHEVDINRLAHAGITSGCAPERFCPNDEMRRDDMASFLVRAIPLTVGAGRDYFYDDNENAHEADIDRAAAAGITSGCATWRYCPAGSVTRGQMAAYLHRIDKPVAPPPYPAPAVRTLYVAPTGSDESNDCLAENVPCGSVGHAVSESADGDTVRLAAGRYHEGAILVQKGITFVGASRETTIVDGGSTTGSVFDANVYAPVTIGFRSMTITGGHSTGAGGGIRSYAVVSIEDVLVVGNQAKTYGGGIYNGGTMTILRSIIVDNQATKYGGGIWSSTRLEVSDSTICRNASLGRGGGIAADSGSPSRYLRVTRSLICENTAHDGGGGITTHGTPTTISNSTIASNVVAPSYYLDDRGGGIEADSVTLLDSTVTGNSATTGGGVAIRPGGLTLANTLVIANPKGGNVAGAIATKVASIVGIPAGLKLSDILDPDGLQDNGGPTETIALTDAATNPARRHGDAATCAAAPVSGVDQRGLPRTAPCDIGAYEIQP